MAGYSPAETPTIIEDYTDAGLNEYMALIITEFVGQAPNRDECGYGCSDHASANANGFRKLQFEGEGLSTDLADTV
jgi:leucyl aminopeptidase